jgi:hypothetical protein
MKRVISVVLVAFLFGLLPVALSAQTPKEVKLVTMGEGATKEHATKSALRSALEQAFGTFVSANTTILNDELVRDEIATVTTGNISSYKELSCIKSGGNYKVSLESVVAIDKLISYAKSHGSSAEFASQTFLANMRLRELNKQNQQEALANLLTQLKMLQPQMFTGDITVKDPKKIETGYRVPIELKVYTTGVYVQAYNLLYKTLSALSLTESDVEAYKSNDEVYTPIWKYNAFKGDNFGGHHDFTDYFYLRGSESEILDFVNQVCEVLNNAYLNVKVCEMGGKGRALSPPMLSDAGNKSLFRFESGIEGSRSRYILFGPKDGYDARYYPRSWNMPVSEHELLTTQTINFDYTAEELSKISGYEVATSERKDFESNFEQKKQAETETLARLWKELIKLHSHMFTGEISSINKLGPSVNTPKSYTIEVEFKLYTTSAYVKFHDLLFKTLSDLSMSQAEVEACDRYNVDYTAVWKYNLCRDVDKNHTTCSGHKRDDFFYLRNDWNATGTFLIRVCQLLNDAYLSVATIEKGGSGREISPDKRTGFWVVEDFIKGNGAHRPNGFSPKFSHFLRFGMCSAVRYSKVSQIREYGDARDFATLKATEHALVSAQKIKLEYTQSALSRVTGYDVMVKEVSITE